MNERCERCGQQLTHGRHTQNLGDGLNNRKCSDLLALLNPANQVRIREADGVVAAVPVGSVGNSKLQFVYGSRRTS